MPGYQVTGSIVLYNSGDDVLEAIKSFSNTESLKTHLYLIDNSPTNIFQETNKALLLNNNLSYVFNGKNLGYGAAHNLALQQSINQSQYHLILNPDVKFEKGTLEDIYAFMQSHKTVGQLLPQVLNKDKSIQKLCKLLPTPFNLIGRRFFQTANWAQWLNEIYHLQGFKYDHCINLPNLSGCFMFLRNEVIRRSGLFDTRYFMYMEDMDLTRRLHRISETLFYPYVSIYHGYEKASYSDPVILKYHLQSAIKYFNKWGWFFDIERSRYNANVMSSLKNYNHAEAELH